MTIEMKVNNIVISSYNAELVEYSVDDIEIQNTYIYPHSSIIPTKTNKRSRLLRKIRFVLDFNGSTKNDIENNIKMLKKTLIEPSEVFLPDGFYYYSFYESASAPEDVAPWISQVEFTMYGVRHGDKISNVISGSTRLNVLGDVKTPVQAIISSENSTFKVLGITISNITGDVTIDSIAKKVTDHNGMNKFKDTDLVAFPTLDPGVNQIEIVGSGEVELSYYPLYL